MLLSVQNGHLPLVEAAAWAALLRDMVIKLCVKRSEMAYKVPLNLTFWAHLDSIEAGSPMEAAKRAEAEWSAVVNQIEPLKVSGAVNLEPDGDEDTLQAVVEDDSEEPEVSAYVKEAGQWIRGIGRDWLIKCCEYKATKRAVLGLENSSQSSPRPPRRRGVG